MIKHILFWTFNEQAKEGDTAAMIEKMHASAQNMVGKIDGLITAGVYPNLAGGSCDFIFYSEFATKQALDAYQTHPLHQAHKEMSKDWLATRIVGDFESEE